MFHYPGVGAILDVPRVPDYLFVLERFLRVLFLNHSFDVIPFSIARFQHEAGPVLVLSGPRGLEAPEILHPFAIDGLP